MNRPCPRCGQNLIVHPRGPAMVTCPVCLASVTTGSKPLPIPPLPAPPMPVPVIPLPYGGADSAEIERELKKDLRFGLYGIGAFAVVSLIGYFAVLSGLGMEAPPKYALIATSVITAIVALPALFAHRARRSSVRSFGMARFKTTGERVITMVALGSAGIALAVVMFILTAIALFVIAILTCKVV